MKEIELIDKREANVKHFLQPDGTIKAKVYNEPVHYLKDGKYEEIDNTLVKKGNHYENKSNDYKVSFKNEIADSLIRLEKDDAYLDISLDSKHEGKIKMVKTESNIEDVLYENILDNVDIEYATLPTKVKETIILKDKKISKLTFMVNTNLSLGLNNGSIKASKDDNEIFTIEKPFMIDSSGNRNDNISYEITKTSDTYKIDLLLDQKWLNNPNTIFPVYVDPTIANNSTHSCIMDTYIYDGDTADIRYNQDILKAGVEKVSDNNYRTNRTLIKFDLPQIGTGSEVIKATLTMCGYVTYHTTQAGFNIPIEIHRITESWNEQDANWANMHDKFDSKVDGVQFASRSWIENNTIIPQYTSDPYGDITDLVKHWYKDTDNFGIMIKSVIEEYVDDNYPAFYSKEHTIPNANPEPVLEIIYQNQNGLENYWDYITTTFKDGATYVNTYNGNLVGVFNIGSTVGTKLPANLKLVYNTNDVLEFNNGFKFNFMQTIKEITVDNNTIYEYADEENTIHYFKNTEYRVLKDHNNVPQVGVPYNEEDYYETREYISDQDGLMLKLEFENDSYIITDKYGNKLIFVKNNVNDNIYYLRMIEDIEENTIVITYDSNNRIVEITAPNFEKIEFNYSQNNSIIIDGFFFHSVINYLGNNITSLSTINGTTTFTYNQSNLIQSIVDVSGLKTEYEYYQIEPYRVKKIMQVGLNNNLGETIELKYGFNNTTITYNDDTTSILAFNSSGNKISTNMVDSDGNISLAYSTYDKISENITDEYYKKNKPETSNAVVRYTNNLLQNTSFETNDDYFILTSNLNRTYDTNHKITGNRCLKLESFDDNQIATYSVTVPKGKYYTFSGYFKNTDDIVISLSYYDSTNQLIEKSKTITANSSFDRENITILYDDDAMTQLSINIVLNNNATILYLDDIQLEEGEIVNYYNIIENSNFSAGFSDWTGSIINPNVTNTYEVVSINGVESALKIKLDNSNGIQKTLPINGKAGDVYDISFWIKNSGIYADGSYVRNCLEIMYNPVDPNQIQYQTYTPQFLPNSAWQFVNFKDVALYDFESITIQFSHTSEFNDLYVTNLFIYKDLNTTYYDYDNYGNLISTNDSNSAKTVYNFDEENKLLSLGNPIGANFRFEYDNVDKKKLINSLSGNGIGNRVTYDYNGNPTSIRTAKSEYFNLGNALYNIRCRGTNKYIKLINGILSPETDSCSNTIFRLHEILDEDYFTTSEFIIYLAGNTSRYLKASNNKLLVENGNPVETRYGNSDYVFLLTERKNGSYTIEVDSGNNYHRLLKVINNILTLVESTDYDDPACQFYFELANEEFIETDATYSGDGRFITSVTDSLLNKSEYSISSSGLVQSYTTPRGKTVNYQYDNKRNITKMSQGSREILYEYNNQNVLSKITQGTKEYNIEYDDFLNRKKIKLGNNITLITNNYNIQGNLNSLTYGNSDIVSYSYDNFDRIKTINKMDDTYNYLYNYCGNIAKIKSNSGIKEYYYNNNEKISKYVNDNFEIKYDYNLNSDISMRNYKLSNLNDITFYAYDKDNNLIEMEALNNVFGYFYDNLGRLCERKINNFYLTRYDYVHRGNRTGNVIESITNGSNKYSYKYDNNYNITHIYKNSNLIKQYEYDDYDQLVKEINNTDNTIIEYSYDNTGNILSKTVKDQNDNIIHRDNYTYNNSDWEDQLTSYNTDNITYDNIGNPLSIGSNISMSWVNGRELNTYINSNSNLTVLFKYDSDGIRTSKIVNNLETKYYLENNKIIYEQTGSNINHYLYDLTGVMAMIYNNTIFYYIKNAKNDIIGILDSNYNQIVSYEYDSWGKVLSVKDANNQDIVDPTNIGLINPFRYRSYYYDSETGLYYLNSRYYNPEWGRFINPDGIIGTPSELLETNLYCYANNNPITNTDSDGNFAIALPMPEIVKGIILIGAAILTLEMAKYLPSTLYDINSFINSIHQTKNKSNATAAIAAKDAVIVAPNSCPVPSKSGDTVIYRYGYEDVSKLVPTERDVKSKKPSLSFSTRPRMDVKSAVTTINTVNSTGVLHAKIDNTITGHVDVTPVGGTIKDWYDQGVDSIWTKTLNSIVIIWDGQ